MKINQNYSKYNLFLNFLKNKFNVTQLKSLFLKSLILLIDSILEHLN